MNRSALICIARHGETDWNLTGTLQGWIDIPINEQGRRQADEMAASFASEDFSSIWSSPLRRACETAEIIAAALRLPLPLFHDGLKERCFGAIQGIPKAELAELNPVLLQQLLKRNPATHFEAGESMDEFATRVLDAVMEIAALHPGQRLLVITHGWVMDVLTRQINGLQRNAILNLKRKNGETLWLEVRGQLIKAAR
jgi:broad specificity phosphatase PhoE